MPTPNQAQGTYNPILTNIAIGYEQSLADYIAPTIFPIVPSAEGMDTGIYKLFGKEAYRRETTLMADGDEATLIDFKPTEGTYRCHKYGKAAKITDGERRNNTLPGSLEQRKTKATVRAIMLDWEFRVSALLTNTGTFANDTPTTKFDNDGDFVEFILEKKEIVRKAAGGQEANCLVMSPTIFRALQTNVAMTNRLIYTQQGPVTLENLMAWTGLPYIRLAKAVYNSAKEGQTAVMTDVWGDSMFLGWVTAEPSLDEPTLGLTIRSEQMITETWSEKKNDSDFIRSKVVQTELVTCPDAGYVITDCLT